MKVRNEMNVRVPLWGVVLTGFTMLFSVGYQHQLGILGAIEFCYLATAFTVWGAFVLIAVICLALSIAVALYTFIEGFKKVKGERGERYFLNRIGCSTIFLSVGFFFAWIVYGCSWAISVVPNMISFDSLWIMFWKVYFGALGLSLIIWRFKKSWRPDW